MKSNTSPTGNALTYPGTYDLKQVLDNRQRIKTRAEYNGRIFLKYFSDQGKGKEATRKNRRASPGPRRFSFISAYQHMKVAR